METVIARLEPQTKRKLRVDAAKRGKSMTQHMIDLIENGVLPDKSLEEPRQVEVQHG